MKKITNTTTEEKAKLQPFPFIENEDYLLKLKNETYVIACWQNGQFFSDYNGEYIEDEIGSYILVKELGLWKLY